MLAELGTLVGIPILRSVGGWLTKSLDNGKIDMFEWKLLVSTVIRVGLIGTMGYFGLNSLGMDISAFGAAASAYVVDILFSALKKNINVDK